MVITSSLVKQHGNGGQSEPAYAHCCPWQPGMGQWQALTFPLIRSRSGSILRQSFSVPTLDILLHQPFEIRAPKLPAHRGDLIPSPHLGLEMRGSDQAPLHKAIDPSLAASNAHFRPSVTQLVALLSFRLDNRRNEGKGIGAIKFTWFGLLPAE